MFTVILLVFKLRALVQPANFPCEMNPKGTHNFQKICMHINIPIEQDSIY